MSLIVSHNNNHMVSVQHQQWMPSIPDLPGEIPDHVLQELDNLQKATVPVTTPPESIEQILKDLMELDALTWNNFEISTNFSGQIGNQTQPRHAAFMDPNQQIREDQAAVAHNVTAAPNIETIDRESVSIPRLINASGKTEQCRQMDSWVRVVRESREQQSGENFHHSDVVYKIHHEDAFGWDGEIKRTREEQQRVERAEHYGLLQRKQSPHTEMNMQLMIQSSMTDRLDMMPTQPNNEHTIHADARPYECGVCRKSFRRKCDLVYHSRIHSDARPYECGVCKKSFRRKYDLEYHSRIHSDARPYECGVCKKSFRRKYDLEYHSRIHSDERPYECGVCKKSFRRKRDLVDHSKIHTDGRAYKCGVCKKSFRRKCDLVYHSMIHSDSRPYECGVCKKSFRRKCDLVYHSRIHSDARPYECGVCKKSFRWKCDLVYHSKVHSGERGLE